MLSQLGSKAHLVDRKMYPPLSRTAELYHELLMTNRIKLNKKKKKWKKEKKTMQCINGKEWEKAALKNRYNFQPNMKTLVISGTSYNE